MDIIKEIPTSSKRRINQCLELVKKLKLEMIEKDVLKTKLKEMENLYNSISIENKNLKDMIENSKEP